MTEKEQWIIDYISNLERVQVVDILDEDFVNAFIKKFNPKYEVTLIGAYRCKELSLLLGKMYKKCLLNRCVIGLRGGAWQDGFPKWVYSYSLF